jgi:hypothetical protein
MPSLNDETIELLTYFDSRNLGRGEACTVMGIALTMLIDDEATAYGFLHILQDRLNDKLKDIRPPVLN